MQVVNPPEGSVLTSQGQQHIPPFWWWSYQRLKGDFRQAGSFEELHAKQFSVVDVVLTPCETVRPWLQLRGLQSRLARCHSAGAILVDHSPRANRLVCVCDRVLRS